MGKNGIGLRAALGAALMLAAPLASGAGMPAKRTAWLEILYQAPKIVERMGFAPGARVAVFGLSDQAFLKEVFRRAGADGVVYTVDRLRTRYLEFLPGAREEFGDRLRPIFALDGDAHLDGAMVDAILLIDRDGFFQFESSLYAQAARALRPGGRLTVLRLRDQELSQIPAQGTAPGRQRHSVRLDANRNTSRVQAEGFRLLDEDLEILRQRSVRVYEKVERTASPVNSGSTEPPGGSAPPDPGGSRPQEEAVP